ncbi:uncharacterized protein A4U43_C02F16570 [Asparagus officinalis]|uniref:Uncharacterized protein n=1 Tax=Asparagus officinalis TaxID=4686 RepID=A0A5P1FIQ4_ASPOF|nr:uncharacterized protein A4U43_C02F16570 [Asparagus officinalis]
MAKGFDPELEFKLKLGREPHVSPNDSDSMRLSRVTNWLSNMQEYQHPHPQQQQITIFYNGKGDNKHGKKRDGRKIDGTKRISANGGDWASVGESRTVYEKIASKFFREEEDKDRFYIAL